MTRVSLSSSGIRILRPITLGFLLCAGVSATVHGEQRCPQPLHPIPDGWLLLPAQIVDWTSGAYHDASSGAFVSFDGIPKALVEMERAGEGVVAERPHGVSYGVPYRLEVVPDIRDHLVERGRREFGNEYPENITGGWSTLPLPGARRLSFTFIARSMEWHFESDVYDDRQEDRVRRLLMGSVVCGDRPDLGSFQERVLSEAFVSSAIATGDSASVLLKRLGAPYSYRPEDRTGFRLLYEIRDAPEVIRFALRFDQQQRLLERVELE